MTCRSKVITAQQIEIAVAKHFNSRANVIVPNVYFGLGLPYEADLVVLRPSDWAIEIEIKISAADIKADLKKRHRHDSLLFRQLYFAVPEALADHPDIPDSAGILSVCQINNPYRNEPNLVVKNKRAAALRKGAVKWKPSLRQKLCELAAMRIWTLKEHLHMGLTQRQKGSYG